MTSNFRFYGVFLFMLFGTMCITDNKEAQTLGRRVHELMEMSTKRAIIKLTGDKFRRFVRATPRNYSFIVMLTALSPYRQCIVCRYAYEEFQLVASSWLYSQINTNKLFFGMIDFDDEPDVYSSLGMNSAPVFMHFPEKGKPKKGDTMDIHIIGFQAETIAKWIARRTDIQIRVLRPPNYFGTVAFAILFALIGALLYIRRNNLDFMHSKKSWGVAALCEVFVMTSGQMWNHIRGPAFMRSSSTGSASYIHGSSSGQYIVETYIVIILNVGVTFGMILMQEAATSKGDSNNRKNLCIAGLALVVIFFTLITSMFKMKAQGYPI